MPTNKKVQQKIILSESKGLITDEPQKQLDGYLVPRLTQHALKRKIALGIPNKPLIQTSCAGRKKKKKKKQKTESKEKVSAIGITGYISCNVKNDDRQIAKQVIQERVVPGRE